MPPDPPVPVSATFIGPILKVTFDQDLQLGVLDTANWLARRAAFLWTCGTAQVFAAAPRVVACGMAQWIPELGGDACWYSPPPFDVISVKGVPAQLFAEFPVT